MNSQTASDITLLDLDHPGAKDPEYRARRDAIATMTQNSRLTGAEPPVIDYTPLENHTWALVNANLRPLHKDLASSLYLNARDQLDIPQSHIPQLKTLSTALREFEGFSVGAVEGLVDGRTFLGSFGEGKILCTQYIRHHSKPEYTPEPDIVHEVLGHVPMFVDPDFVHFSKLIGAATLKATSEELVLIDRLYWFTIEFGLIREGADTKVYGAGLLSSFGEIKHCLTTSVEHRPFSLEEVLNTPYDFSQMQDKLFVIHSFKDLLAIAEPFLNGIIHKSSL